MSKSIPMTSREPATRLGRPYARKALRPGSIIAAVLMAMLDVSPAGAQINAPSDDEADAIIVVGQRHRPIGIAPHGLAVSLSDQHFAGVNAINTEDLMKYAPDFFVRKRYSGDSNGVPGFRGTHSTQSARTLVMIDGFVVSNFLGNSFAYSPKWGVVGPGEVEQFDIVYGPYSSRYVGNSMGGIVNITTRDPDRTEVFAKVQGMVQPFRQFSTRANYWGGSAEAGFGLRQKNGSWSVRASARYFRNTGQPMSFLGVAPGGGGGAAVTGSVIDPLQVAASAGGTGLENVPAGQATPAVVGSVRNPIFAAQSPARITQLQGKVKIGYDDGATGGQLLFAYWHNLDRQYAPDCYLRDALGKAVCDGDVTVGGAPYTASGANWSRTERDEFLVGLKLRHDFGGDWQARLALSTYQIANQRGFTSRGYTAGAGKGAGTLAGAGPIAWYTADLAVEHKGNRNNFAFGSSVSLYRISTTNYTLPDWTEDANKAFATQTFGKTRILSSWAEDTLRVGENIRITVGLRLDDWLAFGGGLGRLDRRGPTGRRLFNSYTARHETAISPTLAGQVDLDGTVMQLSLAMATRFPTVGELYQGSLDGDGSFNVNTFDPDLKPERSKDINFLISRQFGRVKLTGSVFWQRVNNSIFQFFGFNQNGNSTSTFKNIDVTRQWGAEAIVETNDWLVDGLAFDGNVAYIDSKTLLNISNPLAEGVQFPRIPKWRANANLRYELSSRLRGSVGMRYASRPNTDLFGLQRGRTFGFTSELFMLDAKINWRVTDQLTASVGVDNITNFRAWVFHPYPRRTFLLEFGWRI